ncbi:MFS transporter [Halorubrum sp. JWXQ-INN 858]|uniref:MFS transporter n=1 Tax=Halorubrum sp. JWXQ-INN 858 TaxID=2690782 RepID=UPI0013F9B6C9|nr:MFS transporter [Halorubrum sp. JWXQ-INN 858]MWV64498.1 MFS transporter [Halorubrum sp. JWXQ-INN 858]
MTNRSTVGPLAAALADPTKRRWIAWGALAIVFLLVNLHRLSTAVLSEELTAEFTLTAAQLGALHASFFVVYAAVQVPTGVLVDRVGPRTVGAGGAVLLSLGAVGFALGDGYLPALVARGVIGLGSGVIFVAILRFCANWYRTDEFATMTGLTGAFAGLGAILATTPLAVAVGLIGWRTAVLALAAAGFLAGVAAYVLVRNSPSDAGLDPIANVPEQPAVSLRETGAHLRELARDPAQWLLSVVFFAANGTLLTLIGLWGVPYLVVVYDLEVATASTYTLLGAVGMLFGGPTIGWLSDRFETRYLPMAAGIGVFGLAHAIIALTGRPPLAVVAAVYAISGFLIGSGLLTLTVVKERYPAGASGVATATVNAAGFVGASLLPWAMGRALDAYRTGERVGGTVAYTEFGYRVAFGITATTLGVAFCCTLLLWALDRRDRGSRDA